MIGEGGKYLQYTTRVDGKSILKGDGEGRINVCQCNLILLIWYDFAKKHPSKRRRDQVQPSFQYSYRFWANRNGRETSWRYYHVRTNRFWCDEALVWLPATQWWRVLVKRVGMVRRSAFCDFSVGFDDPWLLLLVSHIKHIGTNKSGERYNARCTIRSRQSIWRWIH